MMKQASPTWVSEAQLDGYLQRLSREQHSRLRNTCPPSTNSVRMRIGKIYCQMTIGSTIMPTETEENSGEIADGLQADRSGRIRLFLPATIP